MGTIFIIAGLVLVFAMLLLYARAKMKNIPMVEDHVGILTLTEANFKQQTGNKVVLVDFWAPWCAPCRMMAPVLNEVAGALNGNARVGKINVDEQQKLAQRYNVRGIPTLILFKNGQEVKRFVGVKTKDFLLKEMAQLTK